MNIIFDRFCLIFIVFCFVFGASVAAQAEEGPYFLLRKSHTKEDSRHIWSHILFKLALEKTVPEYGAYSIDYAPVMSNKRAWKSLNEGRYPNYFVQAPYDQKNISKNIRFIPFPVQLGLLGYRVCFYPLDKAAYIQSVAETGNIKALIHGQGKGWEDVAILRHNGFSVREVDGRYKNLFSMTAAGRFDLFCRGLNEIHDEHRRHKGVLKIGIDPHFAFQYEHPVFYFTHKDNHKGIARIEKGLDLAFNDGSLHNLFFDYYKERLNFTDFEKRTVFHLNNPLIDKVDPSYKRYNFRLDGD